MRKVISNQFFILAILLFVAVSAFSFVAVQKARKVCSASNECYQRTEPKANGEMIWDVVSRQFISVSFR